MDGVEVKSGRNVPKGLLGGVFGCGEERGRQGHRSTRERLNWESGAVI